MCESFVLGLPKLLVVADEDDLFGVVASDGNEAFRFQTHATLVNDQLVHFYATTKYFCPKID